MSEGADALRAVEIFAATSSGCARLARQIGLPVACLRVAANADTAIAAMNDNNHGGWALWPNGFQPFEAQSGWRDWRVLALGPVGQVSTGVPYANGRFALELPAHVTASAFETALHAEFRRFSVAEVTTMPRWLIAQSEAGRPVSVSHRYTLADDNDFRAGAMRLDDLFVMDPACHVSLIARIIATAKVRAIGVADEALRHA